ncbi:MAG: D-alanyl-D-alanine carboxypeptidase [Gammaproteobacteria bacterium]|nr:D-alanyl-D-alanine carboxypeptidase [Gammaproteobacteria bacterium]
MFKSRILPLIGALTMAVFSTATLAEDDNAAAQSTAVQVEPAKPTSLPPPPSLSSQSYVLIDYRSGRVLVSYNPDRQIEPASLTKMMTSYIVSSELAAGSISWDDKVKVSRKAYKIGGSSMFLEEGTFVSVENLKRGMVIQSGNDATIALAEHLVGSEDRFVQIMNDYAKRLGLSGTQYKNSTGMPADGHYSTSIDLAKLGAALIRDFPDDYSMYAEKEFEWAGISQPNRNNLLLRDATVDGIKTGHTNAAGYCLVASAERNGTRLISVVTGAASAKAREDDSLKLLRYGFDNFATKQILAGGTEIEKIRVLMGEKSEVSAGLASPLFVSVPNIAQTSVNTQLILAGDIVAPVRRGQAVATVVAIQDGKEVARKPVVALEDIEEGAWWQKLRDQAVIKIEGVLPW